MKKVELFETYASDCKCGGNCTCGTSKVNEAKKLKYKDIHDAWNLAYGEDFEYEYEGVYQEIVGKHRGKISKGDLAKLWDKMYGEDLAADYSGFFDQLDESMVTEAFSRMSNDAIENELYAATQALTTYYDWLKAGNDAGKGKSIDHIISLLKKCKSDIKRFNDKEETIGTEYEAPTLESSVTEANADGTISDDEDERRDELEYEIYHKTEELIQYLKDEAENIGGPFRSPGIISDCVKQIKDAFRKNKIRL